jgi:Tfp pilus assembly pilus retraction ATPase PilT
LDIRELLTATEQQGASDLHLSSGVIITKEEAAKKATEPKIFADVILDKPLGAQSSLRTLHRSADGRA